MKKLFIGTLCATVLGMCACSGPKGWKVEGALANATDSTSLVLEGFNGANWYVLDTLKIKNGKFAYASESAAPYSEIFRLTLDGKSIYFPIDSIETVTIAANAQSFDTDYELGGSEIAATMASIDKQIAQVVAQKGASGALTDSVLKRTLNDIALADSVGVVAYYVINKTIGGQPLYSTTNRRDIAMIGAVANKLLIKDANDPRAAFLTNRFLVARRDAGFTPSVTYEAPVTGLVEIELYDVNGHQRKLSDTAKGAGITLLSFTSYLLENSLAYNVELNRLYDLFKDKGIAIYQVSIDPDEVEWRQAASNLPWTAVRNSSADGDKYLMLYNVDALPLTFVIDGNGDLVERITMPTELEAAIRKHLK